MRFTTTILSEPVRVRLPGRRSQALSVAVLENGALKVRAERRQA